MQSKEVGTLRVKLNGMCGANGQDGSGAVLRNSWIITPGGAQSIACQPSKAGYMVELNVSRIVRLKTVPLHACMPGSIRRLSVTCCSLSQGEHITYMG